MAKEARPSLTFENLVKCREPCSEGSSYLAAGIVWRFLTGFRIMDATNILVFTTLLRLHTDRWFTGFWRLKFCMKFGEFQSSDLKEACSYRCDILRPKMAQCMVCGKVRVCGGLSYTVIKRVKRYLYSQHILETNCLFIQKEKQIQGSKLPLCCCSVSDRGRLEVADVRQA